MPNSDSRLLVPFIDTRSYAGQHFVTTGEIIDILPGMQKHTNAVTVDMCLAYLILEIATIDHKRRVKVPRHVYSMNLTEVLDLIIWRRRQSCQNGKVFNDNTICLAAIEATLTTRTNGPAVCKEDALYVPTYPSN